MPEKNHEVKGKPDPTEQRPRDTNEARDRALGSVAINGASKKK